MRKFKKVLLYFISFLILVLIGAELALMLVLNQKITDEIRHLLDEKLESRVEFHELRASLLSDFPNFSISLDSVKAWEGPYQIVDACSIKAELSLVDYIVRQYLLHEVEISGTTFLSPIDSLGNRYMIRAKPKNQKGVKKDLSLDIPSIRIRDSRVIVSNDYKKNWLDISIDRGQFELIVMDSIVRFEGDASGVIDSVLNRGDLVKGPIPVKATNASYSINTISKKQNFEGILSLFEIDLSAQGQLEKKGNGNQVNISLVSKTESFDEYLKLIPHIRILNYKQINPEASVHFELLNTGFISPVDYPDVRLNAEVIGAEFTRDSLESSIKNVNLKGFFQAGAAKGKSAAKYVVQQGSAHYLDNFLELEGSLENLEDPILDLKIRSEVDLAQIRPVFKYPHETSGMMTIDLQLEGKLSELRSKTHNNEVAYKGSLHFKDIYIDLPETPLKDFESINGSIHLYNQRLNMDELKGRFKKSNFFLTGEIEDFVPIFRPESGHTSKAIVKIDIDELNLAGAENTTNVDFSILPKNLTLNLDFLSSKFVFQDLSLSKLDLKMYMNPDSLNIKKMSFDFEQGSMEVIASAKLSGSNLINKRLDVTGNFKKLDLDRIQFNSPGKGHNQLLDSVHFSTSINAEKVIFKKNDFYNLKLDASMMDNHMSFDRFNFDIPFGRIRNDLVIDKVDTTWSVKGACQLDLGPANVDSLKNYLANLVHSGKKDTSSTQSNLDYRVDLNVISPKLTYQTMNFGDFDGNYTLRNTGIKIRNMDFEIFNGEFKMTGKIEKMTPDHSDVYIKFQADQIHLGEVIGLFEERDKDLFAEQNFKGLVTMDGRLLIKYDEALNYKEKDMVGSVSIDLEDGELINFKPITHALKFLKKDVTEKIYLSNQKIKVIFHNDEIVIPKTTFASNLSNIEMIGYYSKDFNFGFDMKISLGQLLFQSQRKKKSQINKKDVKVGGLQHFLSARTVNGELNVSNIKNKDYSSDMDKLNRRYVIVDSVLNAVREELR